MSGRMVARRGATAAAAGNKKRFFDSFDRPNGSPGANWTVVQSGLSILNNRLQGAGGFSLWAEDCATDDEFSQATIGPTTAGTLWLYLRCPVDGWPQVLAQVTPSNGNWTVITDPSSAGANHSTRASGSVGSGVITAGSDCRFEGAGNAYSLKVGGSEIGSWPDTGGVITPGPTKRKVGVQISGGSLNIEDWSGGDL